MGPSWHVEAKNESIKNRLLQIREIDEYRISDDEQDMDIEEEPEYEENEKNLDVLNCDPELMSDGDEDITAKDDDEDDLEKRRVLVSFRIRDNERNRNLRIHLLPSTHVRPYQERCLNKMFGNGRARSGLIVLPCGAGKTLVGITACATIKKSCIVVCNSNLSAAQWKDSFLAFCDVKEEQIRMMVKNTTDTLTNPCILITTYYQLVRGKKIRKEREALLNEIAKREWGLLVLDEVHVCPALRIASWV
ncbi:hypothetical protein BLSTO_05686 [Blastocystis sp. subtype 1]